MIASLNGTIKEMQKEQVILEVNGVGYEVFISSKTMQDLVKDSQAQLWIYTHVKEDSLKLFGFASALEKKLFLSFITVNGIGPKSALGLISSAPSLKELIEMIRTEDILALSKLPRIGKKSAGQIILSLKGQLKEGLMEETETQIQTRKILNQALLNLGFRSGEIKLALEEIKSQNNIEEDLKKALSLLQPKN